MRARRRGPAAGPGPAAQACAREALGQRQQRVPAPGGGFQAGYAVVGSDSSPLALGWPQAQCPALYLMCRGGAGSAARVCRSDGWRGPLFNGGLNAHGSQDIASALDLFQPRRLQGL